MATKKSEVEQLQDQVARLERELSRVLGRYVGPVKDVPAQTDYIAYGSDEHAALLLLKKAEEGDRFVYEGWTLEDPTQFGPSARDDYIMTQLRQKVATLTTPVPTPQSDDPRKPHYAPKMWEPRPGGSRPTE